MDTPFIFPHTEIKKLQMLLLLQMNSFIVEKKENFHQKLPRQEHVGVLNVALVE